MPKSEKKKKLFSKISILPIQLKALLHKNWFYFFFLILWYAKGSPSIGVSC